MRGVRGAPVITASRSDCRPAHVTSRPAANSPPAGRDGRAAAVARDRRDRAWPVRIRAAALPDLVRQRAGNQLEVDDPGLGRVERAYADDVRLQLREPLGPDLLEPAHAVRLAAPPELLEPRDLGLVGRDDDLAAALGRDPLSAQNSYISRAPSTQSSALSEPGA